MGQLNLLWSACSNDGGYNILEKPIARILYDILNYREKFMINFFDDVLKATDTSPGEIATAKVDMGKYYFDLFIKTDRQIIPIELKVDARDQNEQCRRYLETAEKMNNNISARMYYLTKDKHAPSPDSLKNEKILENDSKTIGNKTGVVLISYEDEILTWLESCSQDLKSSNEKNLCYQLELFKDIIREHLRN